MSSKKLIAVVACVALLLCAAPPGARAQAGRARKDEEAGVDERVRVRAPELAGHSGWLNTDRPLSLAALRGKIVLLDFWTYGCINCVHIIPDLKRLEAKYAKELVVIGVHSAKFDNEKETDNIRRIVLRYEIEHPVVNDADFRIWNAYAVRAWPTLVLIDPAGYVVGQVSGEGHYDTLDRAISQVADEARKRGQLNEQPLKLALERAKVGDLPLAFPGKVLADEGSGRLFIADSNHNRVVVARLDGTVTDVIGTGAAGAADGAFDRASFFRPQGLALDGDDLYVADTANHLIRRVDLKARTVETAAGTGQQARGFDEGRVRARSVALSSPWDLTLVGRTLYIAMAGPHQIWQLDLERGRVSIFAGSGREARTDGPRLSAAFAQPSGLASDGKVLYVADSESNIIRAIELSAPGEARAEDAEPADAGDEAAERVPVGAMSPADEDETQAAAPPQPTPEPRVQVTTLAGGDLFEFGDADGTGDEVRLQHPLGVAYVNGALYVADTYNHKIKRLDPRTNSVKTFAGTGKPGQADGPRPSFYEPGGLSHAAGRLYVADTNNHAVRTIDLKTGQASTLRLVGLAPPPSATAVTAAAADAELAASTGAEETKVSTQRIGVGEGGAVVLNVALPAGYHLNENAPHRVAASVVRGAQVISFEGGKASTARSSKDLRLPLRLPVAARAAGAAELRVQLTLYYCREDNTGTCRIKTLAWRVPVEAVAATAAAPREIKLAGKVDE